jgi:hypothetical protein
MEGESIFRVCYGLYTNLQIMYDVELFCINRVCSETIWVYALNAVPLYLGHVHGFQQYDSALDSSVLVMLDHQA